MTYITFTVHKGVTTTYSIKAKADKTPELI